MEISSTVSRNPVFVPMEQAVNAQPRASQAGAGGDTTDLSREAMLLAEAVSAAQGGQQPAEAADIAGNRAARVEAIREQVANGTYSVDAGRIALGLARHEPALFGLRA